MSFKEVDWVLDESDAWCEARGQERLTSAEAFVALVIGESIGRENRRSWLGVETMMRATKLGERTVRRALTSLVERGIITRDINAHTDAQTPRHRAPNVYRWAVSGVPDRQATSPSGVPHRPEWGATVAPKPPVEPNTPQPPQAGAPRARRPHCDGHTRYRSDCLDCRRIMNPRPARPAMCDHCAPTHPVDQPCPPREDTFSHA